MSKSVVITVNSITERDIIIRNIYNQLLNEADHNTIIQKDKVNSVRVLYIENGKHFVVCTYIAVILPIMLSLDPLQGITGEVNFRLDTAIKKVSDFLDKLNALQGKQIIKENIDVDGFEKLVRCLA